ncbi:solute carrier family 32 (vesicular inhibitory amino acid transporter) protein [Dioscorea alata]|uniref:Solute carrier family 32 (Vesicular inhibitory amino acid transporter) protein n=1 Tax=Dioscorea alata TaxID=55571 RepID=A0ACB7TWY4_DIOAL|nr:solute carrier family 32 (vesicular inhibitory amino acid transporter) protein [Dioscorea alata]
MESHTPTRTGTTFLRTCFNGVNALAGLGILSIPYALSQGGWLSLILLLTTATICFYTGLLLQRCMNINSNVKTYPDIGELAFGYKGRLAVAIFMYLELYLVAVEFLILEGDHLEKLFPNTHLNIAWFKLGGKQGFVLLASLVILPTTWLRNLSVFSYVSFGGVLASIIVVGAVLWTGVVNGVGFHEKGELINWTGVPTAVSVYAFCYSGHAVFPTIYTSMKERTMFPMMLFICFIICTLNYLFMAIIGYLMYGDNTQSQITLNLPGNKLTTKIAIYITLINPFTKYALLIMPIADAIEESFRVSKYKFIGLLIRTLIVMSTVIVALTVPFFGYVLALTGSFLSSTATMLLPCACYLKIFKDSQRIGFIQLVIIIGIIVIGTSVAVIGTFSSVKQIVCNL